MSIKDYRLFEQRKARTGLLLLPFLLLFIGDAQVPIADSSLTVPLGIFIIVPTLLVIAADGRLSLSGPTLLLIGVVVFGAIGASVTPQSQITRAAAGALPLLFSSITLFVYERIHVSYEHAAKYMLIGGFVLGVAVVALALISTGISGDYYEQKLNIETPLGRSNYLAAFLIFLVALSLPRSKLLAIFFSLAVLCTMSRGGLVMLLLLFVALPLARRDKLWGVGVGGLLVFVVIAYIAIAGMTEVLGVFIDPDDVQFYSTVNRIALWVFGVEVWSSQPLLGVGPNTFRTFIEASDGVEDVWGVHNSILLMLLNYGVLGSLLYTIYLVLIYRNVRAAERADDRFLPLRAVFVVLLIFSLFEPLIGSAAFEMLLALLYVLSQARLKMRKQALSFRDVLNFTPASKT